jgi:hypothetical protein
MVAMQSLNGMSLQRLDEISTMKLGHRSAEMDTLSDASTALASTGLSATPFSSIGSQNLSGMDMGPVEEDFDFDLSDITEPVKQSLRLCPPPGLDVCPPPGLERARAPDEKEKLVRENLRLQYEHAMLMQTSLLAVQRAQVASQYALAAQCNLLPQAMVVAPMVFHPLASVGGALSAGPKQTTPNALECGRRKPKVAAQSKTKAAVVQHDVPKTSVVLRNIPKQFSRTELVELLNRHGFASRFDFVYVPFDFKFNRSVGCIFVNFISHEIALEAFDVFNGFRWETTRPGKECVVNWASPHQGLEAHIEHFRNSPVMHEDVSEECKPALFKHGRQVEFPKPTTALSAPRTRVGNMTGRGSPFADHPQA